ncbi:hypothetical protein LRS71_06940 [Rhodococcus pyridinivorans]|uniref:hypothetical protein n=1 Tax=Rhodococcus pyridinivorans TaxID=103816 RepID=UPI001E5939A7|nr:hypothetical protein [Rhodococcus pyridinivorans]MCD5419295.1 hypothetical protein [Rhodococcus pyridinivorans]
MTTDPDSRHDSSDAAVEEPTSSSQCEEQPTDFDWLPDWFWKIPQKAYAVLAAFVGIAAFACIMASYFSEPWEVSTVGTVMAAVGTLSAVVVALYQSARARKQAVEDRIAADGRLRVELAAADVAARQERKFARDQARLQVVMQVVRSLYSYNSALIGLQVAAADVREETREERVRFLRPAEKAHGEAMRSFVTDVENAEASIVDEQVLTGLQVLRGCVIHAGEVGMELHEAALQQRTPDNVRFYSALQLMYEAATALRMLATHKFNSHLLDEDE